MIQAPVFVLTGGDPLKRAAIYDLVEYAILQGVRTSLTRVPPHYSHMILSPN